MNYITAGGTSPRGKENIYYAAHPDEIIQYAEAVAANLLRCKNIALWYDDVDTIEEFRENLKEMRLIVVAVSGKFLYEENVARCQVIPMARELHIPVLPLVVEPGLEPEFDKIVGAYHCLSMCTNDETQIDFHKKLGTYLDQVLGEDEMKEKVRNAFNMKLFLSYRKKDRAILNELIQKIHADPRCDAVGFWYDEYLVPGEKYDDEIDEHIRDCDLVVFNLTNHVVDEENYILKEEYPNARNRYHKKMLAVEMTRGAAERMIASGLAVEDVIGYEDIDCVAQYLVEFMQRNDLIKPCTIEIEYLLGLAYLYGINVERNVKKALRKLVKCYEADYLPAMDTLIDIHIIGDGVEPSMDLVIELLRREIAILNDVFQQTHKLSDLETLIMKLSVLGDYLRSENDIEEARWAFQAVVDLYESCNRPESNHIKEHLVVAYFYLAKIAEANGDMQTANRYFDELEAVHRADAESDVWDWESENQEIVTMIHRGDSLFYNGEVERAFTEYYVPAAKLAKLTYDAEPNNTLLVTYAGAVERYGDYYKEHKDYAKAKEYYAMAIDLGRKALAEEPTIQIHRAQYMRYVSAACVCEEITEARTYFNKGANVLVKMLNSMGPEDFAKFTFDIRGKVAFTFEQLVKINTVVGRMDEASNCQGNLDYFVELYRKLL